MKSLSHLIRVLFLIIFSSIVFIGRSQEYEVVSFDILHEDLSARINPVKDNNGRKCALIKIYADDKIIDVRGNMVGSPKAFGMETQIYLTDGSRMIEIVFDKHFPLSVVFQEYNVRSLSEATTYVLKLKSKTTASPSGAVTHPQAASTSSSTTDNSSKKNRNNRDLDKIFEKAATFYNEKKYYPEAYQTFLTFAEIAGGQKDYDRQYIAKAYFNAALSAYAAGKVEISQDAFYTAAQWDFNEPTALIYYIACWQMIASSDSSKIKESQSKIFEAAMKGYKTFGLSQPVFLNNVINTYVNEGRFIDALSLLNSEIAANPNTPSLYGLRGFLYDRMGDDNGSEADYRKYASFSEVDAETLRNVVRKLFKLGEAKFNQIDVNGVSSQKEKEYIKRHYFEEALSTAKRAKALDPDNTDTKTLIENLEYILADRF